ncbi:MAG: nitrilase, partial [Anaerolineae bacterium]|nr:nitrilase [Anaerolineae bacterium]
GPDGDFLLSGVYFNEALLTCQIDLNQLHRTRARLPLLRDERPEMVQRELFRIMNGGGDR